MLLEDEFEHAQEVLPFELHIGIHLIELAVIDALNLVVEIPWRMADADVLIGLEIGDHLLDPRQDQQVVVALIDHVLARGVLDRVGEIGPGTGVLRHAQIGDRQTLIDKALHDLLRVVAGGVVRDHDFMGKIEVRFRQACQRCSQVLRPVVGRNADAEFRVGQGTSSLLKSG